MAKTRDIEVWTDRRGFKGYAVGQVLPHPNKSRKSCVVVTECGWRRGIDESDDGDEYTFTRHWAKCRWATRTETAKAKAEWAAKEEAGKRDAQVEAEHRAKLSDAGKRLTGIWDTIFKNGSRPKARHPQGKIVYLSQQDLRQEIYGGGRWLVVDVTGGTIWAIQNNGRDGDMWAANNIQTGGAGAIGACMPYDSFIASEVAEAHNLLFEGD